MKEKRRHRRFKKSFDVKYESKGIAGIESNTKSKDISIGGIKIPINKLIQKGAKLTMEIKLPDEETPITAQGQIMWVKNLSDNPHGDVDAGIKFSKIDKAQKEKLLKATKEKKSNA